MTPRNKFKHLLLLWLLWVIIGMLVFGGIVGLSKAGIAPTTMFSAIINTIRAQIVVLLLLFGWRDLVTLIRRPAKNLGRGISRVWSVARVTLFEAWYGRIWLLPLLWIIASIIMLAVIKPFDESDRMSLNIRTLLSTQEYLLLVMIWVMACLSLPRERERKIVITNASKPLSRLEIVLGKMTGFSVAAGLMLAVMGLLSWGILHWQDGRIRHEAAESYQLQMDDFRKNIDHPIAGKPAIPPSEGTRVLSEEGSLFAYNYINVPPNGMSICGFIDFTEGRPIRYLKGASSEKATFRFPNGLNALESSALAPVGVRPFFIFNFPMYQAAKGNVQIRVSAQCTDSRRMPPPKPQEKILTLNEAGRAVWEPDEPLDLYSFVNDRTGEVLPQGEVSVDVTCLTPGAYLKIIDGADPNPKTGEYPPGADFNLFFIADRRQPNYEQTPHSVPEIRGFERRDREDIAGPKPAELAAVAQGTPPTPYEMAAFRFSGKDLHNIPLDDKGNFALAMQLYTFRAGNQDQPTYALISVYSLDAPSQVFHTRLEVAEKQWTRVPVPASFLGNTDESNRGDLIAIVQCETESHWLSFKEDSVRVDLHQTPFFANLIKSEAVIFFEAVVMIAISVACSVRLGWPMAMLCSFICFMFGNFVEFIASLEQYGGLMVLNYKPGANPSATYHFFDTLTGGIWKFLGCISAIVPNFTVYDPRVYIGNLQNMPASVLLWDVLWTIMFVAPLIALAYLMARKQELG